MWLFLSLVIATEYVPSFIISLQFTYFICISRLRQLALVLGIFLVRYLIFLLREGIFIPKNMPSGHRNFLKVNGSQ